MLVGLYENEPQKLAIKYLMFDDDITLYQLLLNCKIVKYRVYTKMFGENMYH